MKNPLDQFSIRKIFDLNLFGIDISITNSTVSLIIVTAVICLFFAEAIRKAGRKSKLRTLSGLLYNMISDMLENSVGEKGKAFLPFVLSLFLFITFCNILGLFPYNFTPTSHINVTLTLGILVFFVVTIVGFYKHGIKYMSLFVPTGTPIFLMPMMFLIELFAYLVRPISLALRLAANMIAGHVVLKVIASFIFLSGIFGFIPFGLLLVLTAVEVFVAILQAYVFAILTCTYINDAVNLH